MRGERTLRSLLGVLAWEEAGRPEAPVRYLRWYDTAVWVAGWDRRPARMWVSPDLIRVERGGVVQAAVAREGVVATAWSFGGFPVTGQRLCVTTVAGTSPVCTLDLGARPRIDPVLVTAGWPIAGRATLGWQPAPLGHWWTVCRRDGRTGWFVVEPDRIGVEAPTGVTWFERDDHPQVSLTAVGADHRLTVAVAGRPALEVLVPAPGGTNLSIALGSAGWLRDGSTGA